MFEKRQKEGGVSLNMWKLYESTQITQDKGTGSTPWKTAIPGKWGTALKVFSTTLLCHVCIYLILGRSRTSAKNVHYI